MRCFCIVLQCSSLLSEYFLCYFLYIGTWLVIFKGRCNWLMTQNYFISVLHCSREKEFENQTVRQVWMNLAILENYITYFLLYISSINFRSDFKFFQLLKPTPVDSVISACPARFRLLDRVTNFKPVFFSILLQNSPKILLFCRFVRKHLIWLFPVMQISLATLREISISFCVFCQESGRYNNTVTNFAQ